MSFKIKGWIILGFFVLPLLQSSNLSLGISLTSQEGCYPDQTCPILDIFPVNLSALFWEDNLTKRSEILDTIGNGTHEYFINGWGGHFTSGHIEGVDHWGFEAKRRLEVKVPIDGTFQGFNGQNDTTISYDGIDLIYDFGVDIAISEDCSIRFAHFDLLKSIFDEVQQENTYSFYKGEVLGYINPNFTMDFGYKHKNCLVCPYNYFNSTIQSELSTFYDLQYQRGKIAGCYPEYRLCEQIIIEIENTLWGLWRYNSGPYDSILSNLDEGEIYTYEPGICIFLNRSFTDPATFHKDPKNISINLSPDVIGVFSDLLGTTAVPNYNASGKSLVKLAEGNQISGIVEIINDYDNDWGVGNTSIYARFSIDVKDSGASDDLLTIEYFDDFISAQAGFTNAAIVYKREYPPASSSLDTPEFPWWIFVIIGPAIVALAVIVTLYIRKKRKQTNEV